VKIDFTETRWVITDYSIYYPKCGLSSRPTPVLD